MNIDCEKIKAAFPNKAWVYAEGLDSVKIGKWNGSDFIFAKPPAREFLLELRVFDDKRELKFTGGQCRDTADYNETDFIPALADAQYFMYGDRNDPQGDFTALSETRGGTLLFPAKLDFPKLPDGVVGLKLGIRNYVRYNPVSVLPKAETNCDFGLNKSGAGALVAIDYAYTGFFYANGKAVAL
jgi:hypothetical protein